MTSNATRASLNSERKTSVRNVRGCPGLGWPLLVLIEPRGRPLLLVIACRAHPHLRRAVRGARRSALPPTSGTRRGRQRVRWWAPRGSTPGPLDWEDLKSLRNDEHLGLVALQGVDTVMRVVAQKTARHSRPPESAPPDWTIGHTRVGTPGRRAFTLYQEHAKRAPARNYSPFLAELNGRCAF